MDAELSAKIGIKIDAKNLKIMCLRLKDFQRFFKDTGYTGINEWDGIPINNVR